MDINGVLVTPLSIINTKGGDVLHAMKSIDQGYLGFGEAYFSKADSNISLPRVAPNRHGKHFPHDS